MLFILSFLWQNMIVLVISDSHLYQFEYIPLLETESAL